jgi:hypothetical protein
MLLVGLVLVLKKEFYMITKIHKLVKYEFQTGNRVGLQHYVECSCGFQGRTGTQVAAESQFDNHLKTHDEQPHFAKLATSVVEEDKSDWKPAGVK